MPVGFPAAKSDIDSRAGGLAVAIRDDLYRCSLFSQQLQNQANLTDAALIALGYTQAEVTLLKAAFLDLANLYTVAHAAATVPSVNDFFFNAKLLTGVV